MDLPSSILVTDTSVLVNFLRIDRMALLRDLPCQFLVTDHAASEVKDFYPEQVERYNAALATDCIEACAVTDDVALQIFGRLTGTSRLGIGESATIALALTSGAGVAIDDRRAINEARRIEANLPIFRTTDLVVEMIRCDLLKLSEADAMKFEWETNHRFRIPIGSFSELL